MTHQEAIKASRKRKLVPDDKFDRHMRRARVKDTDSRKSIFDCQTESGERFRELVKNINNSVY